MKSPAILIIALLLLGASSHAYAADGPTWEVIGMGAVSLVLSMAFAYTKGVSSRVDKLETKMTELNTIMIREYHPKQDVREMMNDMKELIKVHQVEMKANFNELKDRFDKFEQLYGR